VTPPTQKIRLILDLRRAGITDTGLLSALENVPRGLFVPDTFQDQTWEDTALPIGHGQTISQPIVVARMVQALNPDKNLKVLEIGSGSGYQTAILSYLFRRVYAIEREGNLMQLAEDRIAGLRRHNVTGRTGDGSLGWPEQAPFERILVSAASEEIPPLLWDQLAVGGVMVCPLGEDRGEQRIMRFVKTASVPDVEDLGPVRFVPLVSGRAQRRIAV
jgi:protein-L-isoaspartate(D-aspartate) O-methyltransferase